MKAKRSVVGLIAAAAVLTAVPSAAIAAKAHPAAKSHPAKSHPAAGKAAAKALLPRNLVLGSLTSISPTSVTVAGATGSTNVAVTANTRYIAHTQAAATAGLKSGNQVIVTVVTKTSGATAASIIYDTAPFGVVVRFTGTVTGSTATSLTIARPGNQSVTVTINGNTKVSVNGATLASGSAIPSNQPVEVRAEVMTNGSIVANAVVVGTKPAKPAKGRHVVIHGTITGSTTTSLTIMTTNNAAPIMVQLTAQTKFAGGGKGNTAAPTFTANQRVVVIAIKQADGSLVASKVILPGD